MVSKENIKILLFISFISILFYKFIDSPIIFLKGIGGLFNFLSPFLLGILIALLVNPMMMYIEKKIKTPRLVNIAISYIIIFIFVTIGFKVIIPSVVNSLNEMISEIPTYVSEIQNLSSKYLKESKTFESIAPHLEQHLDKILNQIVGILSQLSSNLIVYILSITSLLFNLIMGIILSIYFLLDKEKILIGFEKFLYAYLSSKKAYNTINFFNMCHDIFLHYIVGKVIDSLIIGVLAFIGFYFIGIKHILLLSVIIGLTNILPYFGPFIGAVAPILMTLAYSPIKALWVAGYLLVLQQIDGNIIGPKVMGESVGLSSLWVICAVLIGSSLFGLVGVFLSVPVAAVIKASLERYIEKNLHTKKSQ